MAEKLTRRNRYNSRTRIFKHDGAGSTGASSTEEELLQKEILDDWSW